MASLLSVADALRAGAGRRRRRCRARMRPLAEAHGRVLAADLDGAAHPAARRPVGHGRLCGARGRRRRRAGDAQGDRRGRGRPSVRAARSAPARPRASSPAAWCRRAPTPSSSRRTPSATATASRSRRRAPAGRHIRARRPRFQRRATCCCRAGRRLTDRDLALAAAMNHPTLPVHRRPEGRGARAPATSWCRRAATPGPGRDRLLQRLCADGAGARRGRRGDRSRHRRRTGSTTTVAAIRRAREAGADILVTTGGASVGDYDLVQRGARGRRARAVVLAGRAAAGPADDARAAWRDARARPARQSGLGLCLRASCSWCR